MALWHRSFYGEQPSFNSLFRLLEDWDNYSRDVQDTSSSGRGVQRQAFNPRFDVQETDTAYVLHGELPGLQRENLSIEFAEPQTITIHGRIERSYTSGTPPAVEDSTMATSPATAESEAPKESHQVTVADEEAEAAKEKGEVATAQPSAAAKKDKTGPKAKYWYQERSIGQFHRSFTFPSRVDEEAVTASLSNGILSVTVPKAAKHGSRRIAVQ